MERVFAFLVIFSMNFAIQSFPIENGFSIKFNPISPKEELKPRKFGTLLAKIPQGFKGHEEFRREEVLNTVLFSQKPKLPHAYSNQVAKLLFPTEYVYNKDSDVLTRSLADHWGGLNYLNLPIVRQPFDDYKVLVATAPPNVHLGGDEQQTFIYVVFPQDGSTETGAYNIPVVYFVNQNSARNNSLNKELGDPILIVDSNRTVTGIRSKEIAKYVSFKNKLSDRLNYRVTR